MDTEAQSSTFPLSEGRTYYDVEKKMSVPDKRYLPRWEVSNRIAYHLTDEENRREGRSRDLSSVGICLQTQELLPVNSKVKLVVYLDDTSSIPVEGRVMWCHVANEGYTAGIRFEGITPHDQEKILEFAFEVKHSAMVKHWYEGWKKE